MKKTLTKAAFLRRSILLFIICLIIVTITNSCKKELKAPNISKEQPSDHPVMESLVFNKVRHISFKDFLDSTKKISSGALNSLMINALNANRQVKLNSASYGDSLLLYIDSIKQINKAGHQTYTIPLKQIHPYDAAFRNIIIDVFNNDVQVFIITYAPDAAYIANFVKGIRGKFTGSAKLEKYNINGNTPGLQIQSAAGLKMMLTEVCLTIDVYMGSIDTQCSCDGHHWPGDASCTCGANGGDAPTHTDLYRSSTTCFSVDFGGGGGGSPGGSGGGTSPDAPPDYDPCDNVTPHAGKLKTQQVQGCDVPGQPEYDPDQPQPNDFIIDSETGATIYYSDILAAFENDPSLVHDLDEGDYEFVNSPMPIITTFLLTRAIANEEAYLRQIHPSWSSYRVWALATWNVLGGTAHFTLDVLGLIPGIGEAADFVNAGIYFIEGDRINCALSLAAGTPVTGWVATGGKWVKSSVKFASVPLSQAVGKVAFKAIVVGKDVRLVKVAIGAFNHAALSFAVAVKPANSTLTNISRGIIDKLGLRIAPTEVAVKNLVDDIVANGDILGKKTEDLADMILEKDGYVKYPAQFGSNNGFDGVYIKGGLNNPTDIIINEAKQIGAAGNIKLNPGNFNSGLKSQMSSDWVDNIIANMRTNNNNLAIKDLGNALSNNKSLITKSITAVDKTTKEIVILRLANY